MSYAAKSPELQQPQHNHSDTEALAFGAKSLWQKAGCRHKGSPMAPRGRKARVNPKKKAKDNTPEHKALKELWQHLERSEAQGTNPHHPEWLYKCKRNEKGK